MIVALSVVLSACGGGGGGGGTTKALKGLASCSAVAGDAVICGTAYAPDGQTPIVNAEIVEVSPSAMVVSLKGYRADEFGKLTPTDTGCFTDAAGQFACGGIMSAGAKNFRFTGGGFTKDFSATTILDDVVNIPKADTTATGGTGTYKYAVVLGSYDSIEDVLARILSCGTLDTDSKLTVGTECSQIELIDAYGTNPNTALTSLLGLTSGTYPTLMDFLKNAKTAEALAMFKGVFFNCGMDESFIDDVEVQSALKTYVQNGGNLYASDYAYQYVKNIWPDVIKWYGDPAPDPAPKEGNINNDQPVNVADANLLAWLRTAGVIGTDDTTFNVNFNLPGWVVMTDIGSGTHEILTANNLPNGPGDVPIAGRTTLPITVDFKDGSGCVFYTSYHNEPAETVSTDLPQARALEYMLFNLFGNCS